VKLGTSLAFYLISQRFCVFLDENCPLIKKAGQLILRQQGSHYLYRFDIFSTNIQILSNGAKYNPDYKW
jgi:hypothetical protein